MAALADNPSTPDTKPARRRWRWWLLAAVALLAMAVGGFFTWRAHLHSRDAQLVEKARALFVKKEYTEALAAAQFAVRADPRNLEANRLMAELADLAGSSQAVFWHRNVADLEPGVLEHHLRWAEAGLRCGNIVMAEQALTNISEAGKKTAAYHEIAARVAQALARPADAETHFAEAVKLEPENEKYRFGLASARLESADEATRDEARRVVEKFRDHPEYRRPAHRVLIQDHFRRSQWQEGFLLATDLQATADAPLEDRMLLLDLLRKFKRPELHSYLMDVQTFASRNPEHAAVLIGWMNRNTMALIAADWSKSLPEEIRTRNPVPAAIAESYANLRDWKRLHAQVAEGNWEQTDFMRLALFARVLREDGDQLASRGQWSHAIKAAGERPESLEQLARFAAACRWDNEAVDLLWQVVRGKTGQQWALAALEREYEEKGSARGLLNVASRRLELNPKDIVAQNNVAALSFLLNMNMDRAQALAREAYTQHSEIPAVAATYAYALHLLGKTEDGLKIMRALDEKFLRTPSYAANYGILLVDGGTREEAAKYLEIAQRGKLLREELELVTKASARLSRSAADAVEAKSR